MEERECSLKKKRKPSLPGFLVADGDDDLQFGRLFAFDEVRRSTEGHLANPVKHSQLIRSRSRPNKNSVTTRYYLGVDLKQRVVLVGAKKTR